MRPNPTINALVRRLGQMPRTLSQAVASSEITLGDGTTVGQRNAVDKDGNVRALHPRPFHSYRAIRRTIVRPFFQKQCHRVIDPEANLAKIAEVRARRVEEARQAVELKARIMDYLNALGAEMVKTKTF
jgi:hypothetical protein